MANSIKMFKQIIAISYRILADATVRPPLGVTTSSGKPRFRRATNWRLFSQVTLPWTRCRPTAMCTSFTVRRPPRAVSRRLRILSTSRPKPRPSTDGNTTSKSPRCVRRQGYRLWRHSADQRRIDKVTAVSWRIATRRLTSGSREESVHSYIAADEPWPFGSAWATIM